MLTKNLFKYIFSVISIALFIGLFIWLLVSVILPVALPSLLNTVTNSSQSEQTEQIKGDNEVMDPVILNETEQETITQNEVSLPVQDDTETIDGANYKRGSYEDFKEAYNI